MSQKGLIVAISGAVFVGLIAITSIGSYVSAANYGNATEQRLKAKQKDNENIYASYGQKIAEASQIPSMYTEDLLKITTAAIQGRYGPNGAQSTVTWIKEQNPNLDPKMYVKIMQMVESGRDEFKNAQTGMLDIKRSYETSLGTVWKGFWLGLAGYPKLNLDDYDIVTTDAANKAFKTKREEKIILRGSNVEK